MKRFLAILVVLLALLLIGCSEKKSETEAPEEPTTEGLEYTLLDDGTYAVSLGTAGNNKSIVIPTQYNGRRVSEISEEAFIGCKNITKVVIPNSVTKIGDNAFEDCKSLTSITIPGSVTEIGSSAFKYCKSLTEINVDKNNPNFSSENGILFNKDRTEIICFPAGITATTYTIPDSVTTIGFEAFSRCYNLTSITIPDSVTEIGSNAFWLCTRLTSITIPNSVTEIGVTAFDGCTGLTSVTIPDSVTTIGGYAFNGCTGLTSVTIPDSVTEIGFSAFADCKSLTEINVDKNNPNFSSENGILFDKNKTTLKCYPAGITTQTYDIPNSVTMIEWVAFEGCENLTSITIPNSVTMIDSSAFADCTSLTGITIPDSVTEIGDDAFAFCTSLTNINVDKNNPAFSSENGVLFDKNKTTLKCYPAGITTKTYDIPNSVTMIDVWAFSGCESLTSITIPNSVTIIDSWAFEYCTSLKNIKYLGTVEQWKSIVKGDGWNNDIPATVVVCTDGEVSIDD